MYLDPAGTIGTSRTSQPNPTRLAGRALPASFPRTRLGWASTGADRTLLGQQDSVQCYGDDGSACALGRPAVCRSKVGVGHANDVEEQRRLLKGFALRDTTVGVPVADDALERIGEDTAGLDLSCASGRIVEHLVVVRSTSSSKGKFDSATSQRAASASSSRSAAGPRAVNAGHRAFW
jgi:hypothetical protein